MNAEESENYVIYTEIGKCLLLPMQSWNLLVGVWLKNDIILFVASMGKFLQVLQKQWKGTPTTTQ